MEVSGQPLNLTPPRNIPGLESLNWRLGRIQGRSESSEESGIPIPVRYPTQIIRPIIWAIQTLEWIFFLHRLYRVAIHRVGELLIERTWTELVLAYFNARYLNSLRETEEVYEILDNNRPQSLASYPGPTKQEGKSVNNTMGAFSVKPINAKYLMTSPIWTVVSGALYTKISLFHSWSCC
jgi:hypothetical protein